MRKGGNVFAKNSSGAVLCWLALVISVCAAVRILSVSGLGARLEGKFKDYVTSEKGVTAILKLELGNPFSELDVFKTMLQTEKEPIEDAVSQLQDLNREEQTGESSIPEYTEGEALPSEKNNKLDYSENNIFDAEYLDPSSIQLDNDSGLEIDVEGLLNAPLNFTVDGDEPTVLIVHTHGSEAYTPAENDEYVESDPYRTENNNYNVVRVGLELKTELESYGISVIHDTTLHDYPSYNGSYNRCFETIANYIDEYPSIKIVIDLHRDAIENADGTQYRTVAQIGDEVCSQLLFVMGTNASGLHHPAWQENMKLAFKLQYAMNTMFPSLAKPVKISEYRYNQHMTAGSLILEVGCAGNTLQESVASMKYFAASAAKVLETVTEKEN